MHHVWNNNLAPGKTFLDIKWFRKELLSEKGSHWPWIESRFAVKIEIMNVIMKSYQRLFTHQKDLRELYVGT